jgi:hypothetical protein
MRRYPASRRFPTQDIPRSNPPLNVDAPHIARHTRVKRVAKRARVKHRAAAHQLTLR